MGTLTTPSRHGYNVCFCPFDPDILVVASSQFFGLCGAGTLFLLEITSNGLRKVGETEWNDGLFDVVWSPGNEQVVATSSGDGTLQLWNFTSLENGIPIAHLKAHEKEVYSIDWGGKSSHDRILSASWDRTIKLWSPTNLQSISTFSEHTDVIFDSNFSNFLPNIFSSVGADGTLAIWDSSMSKPCVKITAHNAEILTCAWNRFDSNIIATGGSEGLIRGWDIRKLSSTVFELVGCEYAVRRIQFSPHVRGIILSAGYDFATRIWNYHLQSDPLETIVHHSEFVYGIDWNINRPGQMADCGWDSLVQVFTPKCLENV